MRMSSAIALVPSSPSKLSSIHLWNSSGATLMPKGILFHFILPTGMLKVVSRELGSSSGTCQKVDLISAKVNTLALLISISRWSTVGIGYSEHLRAVFRGLESMQSLIPFLADGLLTMVGALTHLVGSATFSIIPCSWRSLTSAINFFWQTGESPWELLSME